MITCKREGDELEDHTVPGSNDVKGGCSKDKKFVCGVRAV